MSTITVNGTVDNPEPVRTHQEPVSPFSGGALTPGVNTLIEVKGFKNTGNVPQTVSAVVSNVVGLTVVDSYFAFGQNGNTYGNSVSIGPGFSVNYYLNVIGDNAGPGDDTEYSFDIDTTWV